MGACPEPSSRPPPRPPDRRARSRAEIVLRWFHLQSECSRVVEDIEQNHGRLAHKSAATHAPDIRSVSGSTRHKFHLNPHCSRWCVRAAGLVSQQMPKPSLSNGDATRTVNAEVLRAELLKVQRSFAGYLATAYSSGSSPIRSAALCTTLGDLSADRLVPSTNCLKSLSAAPG